MNDSAITARKLVSQKAAPPGRPVNLCVSIENIAKQPKSDTDLNIAISELPNAQRLAYVSYECALEVKGIKTYQDAYDWINKNYPHEDYALPKFPAWKANLIRARKNLGLMKNTPRRGRTGRNIVEESQI